MKRKRALLIGTFQLAVFVFFSSSVLAIPMVNISYIETDLGGGDFQYEYIVANNSDPVSDAGFNIFDVWWDFESDPIDSPLSIHVISTPIPWDWISDDSTFVDAFTYNVFLGIAPGDSLGGFIFQFDRQVRNTPFEAILAGEFYDEFVSGTTAPVPEPSTLILLASGMAGLGVFGRKRFGGSKASTG